MSSAGNDPSRPGRKPLENRISWSRVPRRPDTSTPSGPRVGDVENDLAHAVVACREACVRVGAVGQGKAVRDDAARVDSPRGRQGQERGKLTLDRAQTDRELETLA